LFFSDTAAFTVSPREAVSGLPSAPPPGLVSVTVTVSAGFCDPVPVEASAGPPTSISAPARAPSAAVLKAALRIGIPLPVFLAIAANRLDSSNRICRRTGMRNAMTR
jgi:hypothetical protein